MAGELTWLSTRELAARIAAGEVSAVEAVRDHLARIDEVNGELNAVIALDAETALERAAAADAARAAGEPLGLLHGVPMTHKDSHAAAGLPTTWGSLLLRDAVAAEDCLPVARLKRAGVITTGKTNLPELGAGSHTFNPLFGTTRNPYDRSRSAGGSSGGAAAVIAAGVQGSGDGSDMGGSLRTPGSFNSIVGFRPSNGRLPNVSPNPWSWMTQSGYMAREVGDVALLMQATAGPHPAGPGSIHEGGEVFDLPEFALGAAWEPGLADLRVGFSADLGGLVEVEPEVRAVVEGAAGVLAGLGAEVGAAAIDLRDADEVFRVQRAYDFFCGFGELAEAHPGGIKDFVAENIELGRRLTAADLRDRDRARTRLAAAVHAFFADHDVMVCTSSQVLPFDAEIEYPVAVNGVAMPDYLGWMRAATLVSATGCPAVSVPGGFSAGGLPVGVQIVAAPGRDVELLRVAHAFEAATGHGRRRPNL
ncbi:amidase [Brevibacterium album]|uniref:amidase n=1 Tax=Brevibacterium album TaxID=417948 RepID=UPI00048EA726|nr:amidase family protein [Brevibacterium album]